ncbi:hypothetical protein F2Q68_00043186 [Brassica cretica]|uniref:Uncharacterized protein n=1 Tax=Brassica cretica TaxID=69181 RepID=A0A8S9LSG8_BRACR|nr:hypothetical protein F2Q68_00043186 [Brassica cretica]
MWGLSGLNLIQTRFSYSGGGGPLSPSSEALFASFPFAPSSFSSFSRSCQSRGSISPLQIPFLFAVDLVICIRDGRSGAVATIRAKIWRYQSGGEVCATTGVDPSLASGRWSFSPVFPRSRVPTKRVTAHRVKILASGRSRCWFSAVGACGESLLSVLSTELGSSMKAVRSDEWIGVSLAIGFLASSKVVLIRRSNLQFIITNDGTACLWTPPRAAGLYPVLQGLRVPFSPGARGNWRLHPLIPIHWPIDITLTPVHL